VTSVSVTHDGSALRYSTYLGGDEEDEGLAIAVNPGGNVMDRTRNAYVTGYTMSADFPTENPVQSLFAGGGRDAFVAQIGNALLRVEVLGSGTVTSSPGGINCLPLSAGSLDSDCVQGYPVGTVVILSVHPGEHGSFLGWGRDCVGTPPTDPCALTMTSNRFVVAQFAS
jgi:hypothetical protein